MDDPEFPTRSTEPVETKLTETEPNETDLKRRLTWMHIGATATAFLAAATLIGESKAEAGPTLGHENRVVGMGRVIDSAPTPEKTILRDVAKGLKFNGVLNFDVSPGIGTLIQSRPIDGHAFTIRKVTPKSKVLLENMRIINIDGKNWGFFTPASKAGGINQATRANDTWWVNLTSAAKRHDTRYYAHKNFNPEHPGGQTVPWTLPASLDSHNNLVVRGKNGKLIPHTQVAIMRTLSKASFNRFIKKQGMVSVKHPRFEVPLVLPAPVTTPPPAETTPQPPAPVETQPPIDIAAETEKYLQSETVYLPFNLCSGFLIRDANGNLIGVASAQHCGLRAETTPRILGKDGQLYAVINQPLDVKRGEDINHLSTVGSVKQVIVPPAGDLSHDLALYVLEGSSPDQVESAYNATRITDAELKPGQQVYLSGWPIDQPNNSTGIMRRQTMPTTYLGPATIFTANGQTIPVSTVGINPNKDGSICSWGESGGPGIVSFLVKNTDGTQKVVYKTLGETAGYDDFQPVPYNTVTNIDPSYIGPEILLQRQQQTGFKLTDASGNPLFAGLCDLTSEPPLNPDILNLVNSSSQIP